MRILLTGATGAAGLGALRTLLTDEKITEVTILARRRLPAWVELPGGMPAASTNGSPTHPKLHTEILTDFKSIPPQVLSGHDGAIWALGKSTVGMSEEDYTELTVGYVDAFIDAAKAAQLGSPAHPFRVAFISGNSVDPTEKSRLLFARVKGKAENHLLAYEKESGGTFRAIMLRPGYFFPSLNYPADARHLRGTTMRVADMMLGGLSRWASGITVEDLGHFATEAVKGTWDDMGPYHQNNDMKKLVKQLASP
ncbi:hypothetical protein PENSPDRAFT_678375 [Peniophora sp. CONT]|nr:hypothetical protein PENSPDRAFT_678375 [Peniophora sp. CONT]